jgi:hypothetical protein
MSGKISKKNMQLIGLGAVLGATIGSEPATAANTASNVLSFLGGTDPLLNNFLPNIIFFEIGSRFLGPILSRTAGGIIDSEERRSDARRASK